MSPAMDLTARALDVTARSVDLLNALGETANSPHSVVRVGMEIGRWLGRERLTERELQFCLSKARGLVIANEAGQEFYDDVLAGTQKRVVGPLFVQPSGALGRLLASDAYLCWITSTVACLYEFHGEEVISDTLCTFILQTHRDTTSAPLSQHQLAWHPDRFQLKPVLDKIVSSIWFNVVNSGIMKSTKQGALLLPDELKQICHFGHNLEGYTFGTILGKLQGAGPEVIFESKRVMTDLLLWMRYHHNGQLRVVVGGKIIYNKVLGEQDQMVEFRIQEYCDLNGTCQENSEGDARKPPQSSFRMYTQVAGNLEELLSGRCVHRNRNSEPKARQNLYSTPIQYLPGTVGRDSIRSLTRSTALEIFRWLLELPLSQSPDSNEIEFFVSSSKDYLKSTSGYHVANLFSRVPGMMNIGWSDLSAAKVIFEEPIPQSPTSPNSAEDDDDDDDCGSLTSSFFDIKGDDESIEYSNLLSYYPILRDLLQGVAKNCQCTTCRRAFLKQTFQLNLQSGCLQHTSFMEVMVFIAHGIADGFGAPDVSAYSKHNLNDLGVVKILWRAANKIINWKDWFDVAARTFLGCPSLNLEESGDVERFTVDMRSVQGRTNSTSCVAVAAQYGDLAIVAPWLDLSQAFRIPHCFGFTVAKGRLGILQEGPSEREQFQAIQGEFVVIEAQATEQTSVPVERFVDQSESRPQSSRVPDDTAVIDTNFILCSISETHYRIILRVSSASFSRLIDASNAMRKLCRPLVPVICNHTTMPASLVLRKNERAYLYSSDEIIGKWGASQRFSQPKRGETKKPVRIFHISHVLDSYLKYNIALALALDDVLLINHTSACLSCAIDTARKDDGGNINPNAYGDKWIIFLHKNSETLRDKNALGVRLRSASEKQSTKSVAGQHKLLQG